jgi:hypothetical protein
MAASAFHAKDKDEKKRPARAHKNEERESLRDVLHVNNLLRRVCAGVSVARLCDIGMRLMEKGELARSKRSYDDYLLQLTGIPGLVPYWTAHMVPPDQQTAERKARAQADPLWSAEYMMVPHHVFADVRNENTLVLTRANTTVARKYESDSRARCFSSMPAFLYPTTPCQVNWFLRSEANGLLARYDQHYSIKQHSRRRPDVANADAMSSSSSTSSSSSSYASTPTWADDELPKEVWDGPEAKAPYQQSTHNARLNDHYVYHYPEYMTFPSPHAHSHEHEHASEADMETSSIEDVWILPEPTAEKGTRRSIKRRQGGPRKRTGPRKKDKEKESKSKLSGLVTSVLAEEDESVDMEAEA